MLVVKILRKIALTFAWILGAILLFVIFSVAPIDRYNYKEQKFYTSMMHEFDTLHADVKQTTSGKFSVGFSKVSITPAQQTSLAGYGTRAGKLYSQIHDSVYVRTLVVDNGTTKAAIVSADLLIIPPVITEMLERELPSIDFTINNTYLGATHTHNSIGNWSHGVASFLYGAYSDSIVRFLTDQIKKSIVEAEKNKLPSSLKRGEFPVSIVRNRIADNGGLDSLVHVLEVTRSDSSKLMLMSFTAHPTCISMDDLSLSRDYPGVLVDELEDNGYKFAMFIAGAVGSHAGNAPEHGWNCVDWIPNAMYDRFEESRNNFSEVRGSSLAMLRVPLQLGNPQAKISEGWKVRGWLFNSAFGEYPVYLTALRIGDLVMLGAPCDYSGEMTPPLYELAHKNGLNVMITSFNGGYIGYITPDKYYDVDHYETRLMNWYGPGSGAYLSESMEKLLQATAK